MKDVLKPASIYALLARERGTHDLRERNRPKGNQSASYNHHTQSPCRTDPGRRETKTYT